MLYAYFLFKFIILMNYFINKNGLKLFMLYKIYYLCYIKYIETTEYFYQLLI